MSNIAQSFSITPLCISLASLYLKTMYHFIRGARNNGIMEDRMDYGAKNQVMIVNDIGNSEAGKNGNQFQNKEM